MTTQELKRLVEFCVLMQGGGGIIEKAPSYLIEKFETCDGTGWNLDAVNMTKFKQYCQMWIREEEP